MSCDSESPPASAGKRLKTEISVIDASSKTGEESPEADSCGICYADYGVSIRGEIDCCSHYFCYVCIMEWSKHESRCPMCRQRFSVIRRPPKDGVFPSSRLIKVPLRDQVYHPHGNMTTGPVEPYAEVQCSVCQGKADECLLLLCDLCDTASHTYCVGLGFTVPEGDWFCHDCTVSRATNDNNEIDHRIMTPTTEPAVTVFDIVREPIGQTVRIPRTSRLQQSQSSPSVIIQPEAVSGSEGRNPGSGARTLHRCRYVHRSIRALRDNWNAIRSGSLRFHGNSDQSSGGTPTQRQKSDSSPCGKANPLDSMASTTQQHSSIQDGPSGSKDVDKAWKMMDRAKRMRETQQRTMSHLSSTGRGREVVNVHSSNLKMKNQQSRTTDLKCTSLRKPFSPSILKKLESQQPLRLREQEQGMVIKEKHSSGGSSIQLQGYCEPPLTAVGFQDGNKNETDNAKKEIQALVKLNLKVLSREKQLGVDTFKEVARRATHTILSACGLEHQKYPIPSSSPQCSHTSKDTRKSTLMPSCCRQCFYMFVNSVVKSIMLEKVAANTSS